MLQRGIIAMASPIMWNGPLRGRLDAFLHLLVVSLLHLDIWTFAAATQTAPWLYLRATADVRKSPKPKGCGTGGTSERFF